MVNKYCPFQTLSTILQIWKRQRRGGIDEGTGKEEEYDGEKEGGVAKGEEVKQDGGEDEEEGGED